MSSVLNYSSEGRSAKERIKEKNNYDGQEKDWSTFHPFLTLILLFVFRLDCFKLIENDAQDFYKVTWQT